jgi:hypothetical protein
LLTFWAIRSFVSTPNVIAVEREWIPGNSARKAPFSKLRRGASVISSLAGLLAIAAPFFAGIAASIFFGWLILFGGVIHLVYAWSERGAGAILWQILIGLVYRAAAFYILTHPFAAADCFWRFKRFHSSSLGASEVSCTLQRRIHLPAPRRCLVCAVPTGYSLRSDPPVMN